MRTVSILPKVSLEFLDMPRRSRGIGSGKYILFSRSLPGDSTDGKGVVVVDFMPTDRSS